MTALSSRIAIDNSVISALQEAGALAHVLGLWPGVWVVPEQVHDEARAWKRHGPSVLRILRELSEMSVVEVTSVDPSTEGVLLRTLPRTLGQGEAAAIAIAFHRGYSVALDDHRARRACDALVPPVRWLSTEQILGAAVADGMLSRSDAEAIWVATGITDSTRRIP